MSFKASALTDCRISTMVMSDLAMVMERLQCGDKVRFLQDYYGKQYIELSRGWLLERKLRVALSDEQVAQVKAILRSRRPAVVQAGSGK